MGGSHLPRGVMCIFRLGGFYLRLGWFASSAWAICIFRLGNPHHHERDMEDHGESYKMLFPISYCAAFQYRSQGDRRPTRKPRAAFNVPASVAKSWIA